MLPNPEIIPHWLTRCMVCDGPGPCYVESATRGSCRAYAVCLPCLHERFPGLAASDVRPWHCRTVLGHHNPETGLAEGPVVD